MSLQRHLHGRLEMLMPNYKVSVDPVNYKRHDYSDADDAEEHCRVIDHFTAVCMEWLWSSDIQHLMTCNHIPLRSRPKQHFLILTLNSMVSSSEHKLDSN